MTTKRFFTEAEVKEAENMLNMLAMFSAKFWAEAIVSKNFLCCNNITGKDYVDKDVYYCIEKAKKLEISGAQIMKFINSYYELALERIKKDIEYDECVASVLGIPICSSQTNESFGEINGKKYLFIHKCGCYSDISFGGVDNDPWGCLAKAMKGEIPGIFIGYRKTRIILKERKILLWKLGFNEILMTL